MSSAPGRTRLLASGLLILTFVAGGLAGAASERLLRAREPEQPVPEATERSSSNNHDRGRRGPGPRSILLEPTVLDQLGVNDKQRKKILSLLAQRDTALQKLWGEMEPRMNALRKEYEPRFGSLMEASRAEVRKQMTAEQQKKLDELIQEWRARREAERQNRNGPEPRPQSDSGKTKTEHFE